MRVVRRGRGPRSVLLGLIAGLCAFAFPAVAQAQQGEPWACDNVAYITQFDAANTDGDTLFLRADLQPNGTVDLVELGRHEDINLNAIGFRAQDGFMYAFDRTNEVIVRIGQDANGAPVFTSIGLPAGSPVDDTVTGMVMADGRYAIQQGDTTAIFDVSGATAVLDQTLTAAVAGEVPGGDWAVNPVDGEIYHGAGGAPGDPPGDLWRYEIQGDTLVRAERVSDTTAGGAQWFISDGSYFSYLNAPGGIYRTNLETGEVSQVATGPDLAQVDGASCANTLALKKDANPRTVTQGDTLRYTYTLTSRGLFENPVEFADTLPAGMTYVDGSVEVSPAFGTTNDYGGTGTLEVSGTMEPGMEATITARVRVGLNRECNASAENQAEASIATPGLPEVTIVSDDPTTDEVDDPTAVQVNCGRPRIVLNKGANKGTARPGQRVKYRIRVRNTGNAIARQTNVCDVLPAALRLARAPGSRRVSARRVCWTTNLRPGDRQTFTVVARVKPSAKQGSKRNRATAKTRGTPRRTAAARVRVTPTPVCPSWRVKAAC